MNLNTDISYHLEDSKGPKVNFDIYRMPNPIKPESIPKFRHDTNSVYSMGLKYFNKLEKKALRNFPNPDYFSLNHRRLKNKFKEDKKFSDVYAQRILLNKNTKKNYVSLEKPFPLINKVSSSQAINKTNEFLCSVTQSPMPKRIKNNVGKLCKIRLKREFKSKNRKFEDDNEINNIETIAKNMTFTLKDDKNNIDLDIGNLPNTDGENGELNSKNFNSKNSNGKMEGFFLVNSNFASRKAILNTKKQPLVKTESQIKAEKEKEELDKIENDIVNSFKYQKYKTFQYEDKNRGFKTDEIFKDNNNYSKEKNKYGKKNNEENLLTMENGTKEYFYNHSSLSELKSNFLTQINFSKISKEIVENQLENEKLKELVADRSYKNTKSNTKSSKNLPYSAAGERDLQITDENNNSKENDMNNTLNDKKNNEDVDKKSSFISESEIGVRSKILNNTRIIGETKQKFKINYNRNNKKRKNSEVYETTKLSNISEFSKIKNKDLSNSNFNNRLNETKLIKSKLNNNTTFEKDRDNSNSNNQILINNNMDFINCNQSSSSVYNNNSTDHNEFLAFEEVPKMKRRDLKGNSTYNYLKSPKKNQGFKIYKDLVDCLNINNNDKSKNNYNSELNAIRTQPKPFVPDFEKYKLRTNYKHDGFLDKMKSMVKKQNKLKEIMSKSKTDRKENIQNDINILEELRATSNFNRFKTQSSFIPTLQKSLSYYNHSPGKNY